jgi:cytoskeleton protein RodZ
VPVEPTAASPSASLSNAPSATAPDPAAGAGLVLRFDAQAWIEIRDAGDGIVATGTQPAGATRAFELAPPVSAVIGNPGSVSVTWRGAPYDLKPHIRQGVARFRIEGGGR